MAFVVTAFKTPSKKVVVVTTKAVDTATKAVRPSGDGLVVASKGRLETKVAVATERPADTATKEVRLVTRPGQTAAHPRVAVVLAVPLCEVGQGAEETTAAGMVKVGLDMKPTNVDATARQAAFDATPLFRL